MGRQARRAEINKHTSAEEIHAAYAFPDHAKCECCQSDKVFIRAITMAPYADAQRHFPVVATMPPDEVMKRLVPLKGASGQPEPFIRIGMAYSCKSCQVTLERMLAKLPSWVLVEFNRGPAPKKILVTQ